MVVAIAALLLSGCTFGTLSTNDCLKQYAPGAAEAASKAQAKGKIAEESYGFCADGKRRIEAMVVPLQAHGFDPSVPHKHFEVPNGWCVSAKRVVSQDEFDPIRSLEAVCGIGDASRAYFTGGRLVAEDGQTHYILSTYDREARSALDKRLGKELP